MAYALAISVELAEETGGFGHEQLQVALDSSPAWGAARLQLHRRRWPAPEVELGGEGIVGMAAQGEIVGAVGAAASVGLRVMQFEQAGLAAAVSPRVDVRADGRRRARRPGRASASGTASPCDSAL